MTSSLTPIVYAYKTLYNKWFYDNEQFSYGSYTYRIWIVNSQKITIFNLNTKHHRDCIINQSCEIDSLVINLTNIVLTHKTPGNRALITIKTPEIKFDVKRSIEPSSPYIGDEVKITATITNKGDKDIYDLVYTADYCNIGVLNNLDCKKTERMSLSKSETETIEYELVVTEQSKQTHYCTLEYPIFLDDQPHYNTINNIGPLKLNIKEPLSITLNYNNTNPSMGETIKLTLVLKNLGNHKIKINSFLLESPNHNILFVSANPKIYFNVTNYNLLLNQEILLMPNHNKTFYINIRPVSDKGTCLVYHLTYDIEDVLYIDKINRNITNSDCKLNIKSDQAIFKTSFDHQRRFSANQTLDFFIYLYNYNNLNLYNVSIVIINNFLGNKTINMFINNVTNIKRVISKKLNMPINDKNLKLDLKIKANYTTQFGELKQIDYSKSAIVNRFLPIVITHKIQDSQTNGPNPMLDTITPNQEIIIEASILNPNSFLSFNNISYKCTYELRPDSNIDLNPYLLYPTYSNYKYNKTHSLPLIEPEKSFILFRSSFKIPALLIGHSFVFNTTLDYSLGNRTFHIEKISSIPIKEKNYNIRLRLISNNIPIYAIHPLKLELANKDSEPLTNISICLQPSQDYEIIINKPLQALLYPEFSQLYTHYLCYKIPKIGIDETKNIAYFTIRPRVQEPRLNFAIYFNDADTSSRHLITRTINIKTYKNKGYKSHLASAMQSNILCPIIDIGLNIIKHNTTLSTTISPTTTTSTSTSTFNTALLTFVPNHTYSISFNISTLTSYCNTLAKNLSFILYYNKTLLGYYNISFLPSLNLTITFDKPGQYVINDYAFLYALDTKSVLTLPKPLNIEVVSYINTTNHATLNTTSKHMQSLNTTSLANTNTMPNKSNNTAIKQYNHKQDYNTSKERRMKLTKPSLLAKIKHFIMKLILFFR